ncbi:MAG TPA: 6-phosphogluconolactonase [Candidatus Obscuribacterales bacterium]
MQSSSIQKRQLSIFDSVDDLVDVTIERFIWLSEEAIKRRGRFTVALSGGHTPKVIYERLASPEVAQRIEWSKVYFFMGDERCVPDDSEDNNFRMARLSMLSKLKIPHENLFPTQGQDKDPAQSALDYENTIRKFFGVKEGDWPAFDLMFMGLGPDGHTASLFPNTAALSEMRRLVVANYVERLKSWRITMTLPLINRSRHIIFVVSGSEKADVLADILSSDEVKYPSQLVRPHEGELEWFVDREAAAKTNLSHIGSGE